MVVFECHGIALHPQPFCIHCDWYQPVGKVQIRFCFIAPRENGLGLFFFVSVDMVQSLLSFWLTVACFWIWLQVNKYYDLVNSFYEYGWGQSYHFANRFLLWSLFSRLKCFVLLHECLHTPSTKAFIITRVLVAYRELSHDDDLAVECVQCLQHLSETCDGQ